MSCYLGLLIFARNLLFCLHGRGFVVGYEADLSRCLEEDYWGRLLSTRNLAIRANLFAGDLSESLFCHDCVWLQSLGIALWEAMNTCQRSYFSIWLHLKSTVVSAAGIQQGRLLLLVIQFAEFTILEWGPLYAHPGRDVLRTQTVSPLSCFWFLG